MRDDAYERQPFRGSLPPSCHPRRLAALGAFEPETAHVLDLGCGDGRLLCAMALSLPHAVFVGVDRSPAHLARARSEARRLNLSNIRFLNHDLLDLPFLGTFDVVVSHGVYSWVPAPVRCALLTAIDSHLGERGIAWVSHLSPQADATQAPLRAVARAVGDHPERIRQALLTLASEQPQHMAEVLETLSRGDGYLIHGLLSPHISGVSKAAWQAALPSGLSDVGDARAPGGPPLQGRFSTRLLARAPLEPLDLDRLHLFSPGPAPVGLEDPWTLAMIEVLRTQARPWHQIVTATVTAAAVQLTASQQEQVEQHLQGAARALLQHGILHGLRGVWPKAGLTPWPLARSGIGPDLRTHVLDPTDQAILERANGTWETTSGALPTGEAEARIARLQRRGLLHDPA